MTLTTEEDVELRDLNANLAVLGYTFSHLDMLHRVDVLLRKLHSPVYTDPLQLKFMAIAVEDGRLIEHCSTIEYDGPSVSVAIRENRNGYGYDYSNLTTIENAFTARGIATSYIEATYLRYRLFPVGEITVPDEPSPASVDLRVRSTRRSTARMLATSTSTLSSIAREWVSLADSPVSLLVSAASTPIPAPAQALPIDATACFRVDCQHPLGDHPICSGMSVCNRRHTCIGCNCEGYVAPTVDTLTARITLDAMTPTDDDLTF